MKSGIWVIEAYNLTWPLIWEITKSAKVCQNIFLWATQCVHMNVFEFMNCIYIKSRPIQNITKAESRGEYTIFYHINTIRQHQSNAK